MLCEIGFFSIARNVKFCRSQISSFKLELKRTRSRIPTQAFATPSNRFMQLTVPSESVRRLSPSLLHINEMEVLGEGSFGTCFQGCLQGTPVCLKRLKTSKKENLLHEASILSSLCNYAICFLHGIQYEKEPY